MTPRTLPRAHSRRSRRLALVAGITLMIGTGGVASAGTDDSSAPTATVAGGKTAPVAPTAGESTVPTDSSAPAGDATVVQPLAVVDIGATGPGIDIGTAIDGATAVANLELAAMPVAAGATVAEYSVDYYGDLTDPAAPTNYGTSSIISTATSDMPAADILAAYQAALSVLGEFEATTGSSTSEGVTTDHLLLDAIDDSSAPTSADGSAARGVGDYEIFVTRSEDAPGLVAVEVNQSMTDADGPVPAIPASIAAEFATAQGAADAGGWTMTDWSYTDGFNQFSGGTPYKSLDISFSAGPGTAAELMPIGEELAAEFGPPSYEDTEEADRFFYTFDDDSSWSGNIRDYWVGNELSIEWSYSA
jgi:hypothetical protein